MKGKKYISNNSIKAQELANQRNDKFINDLGDFAYDTRGFTIIISKKETVIARDDILQIRAFKVDVFVIYEIRLQIHVSDHSNIEFGEEIPGWFQFLLRSKEQCPEIDLLWDVKTSSSAFEPKETTIYNKSKS